MFEILERSEMAQGTVVMNVIRAPKIAAKARPGQFVMLRANETGERIPLTMADTDPARSHQDPGGFGVRLMGPV